MSVVEVARAVLFGPTNENVLALAQAVLDDECVELALAVRAGGPHAVRRAIELAALVLAPNGRTASGGRSSNP